MRISYSEDEDYPGQFDLWQANCERSLSGRKGRAALAELEAALVALPSKRLIAGTLDDGADCCAIGALVRHKQITPHTEFDAPDEIGQACGMPRLVAWKVVEMNDVLLLSRWDGNKHVRLTPEERYEAVLTWVRQQLRDKHDETSKRKPDRTVPR